MLTPKQEKYVKNLVSGMSQRKAYKKAFDVKDMSDKNIDCKASKLLKNGEVRARYNELIKKAADRAVVKAEDIIAEYKAIAFANGTDFAEVKNDIVRIKDTDSLDEEKKKAISLIETTKFGINVRTHDKMKALEMLAKYVGIFDNNGNDKKEPPTININVVDNSNLKEIMKEGN